MKPKQLLALPALALGLTATPAIPATAVVTGAPLVPVTVAELGAATGSIAVTPNGDVYVVDTENWTLIRIPADGSSPIEVDLGTYDPLAEELGDTPLGDLLYNISSGREIHDVATSPDGTLYVLDINRTLPTNSTGHVVAYDSTTGESTPVASIGRDWIQFSFADIAVTGDDQVSMVGYDPDYGSPFWATSNPAGPWTGYYLPELCTSEAFSTVYDATGRRMIAGYNPTESSNASLFDSSAAISVLEPCTTSADFSGYPIAMATSPADGLTYIADSGDGNERVMAYDPTDDSITDVVAGFTDLAGIAVRKDGTVYVNDNGTIQRLVSDGDAPNIVINGPSDGYEITKGAEKAINFACEDVGTAGIDTCTATLDGQPIENGTLIDTSTIGSHTLVVTATDNVGNTTTATSNFSIVEADTPAEEAPSRKLLGDYADTAGVHGEIGRLYMATFLRQPDREGYDYWIAEREAGYNVETIAANFLESDEMKALYGGLTDEEFIELLYNNVMIRQADTEGANYWVGILNKGYTRAQVLVQFSQSNEFQALTGTK